MGRIRGTNLGFTLLALTAACGGSTPATTGGGTTASAGGTTAGVGGTSQTTTSSATAGVGGMAQATASASVTAAASGSGGAGGGGEFLCNPAAAPGSIYEATADMFGSAGPESMCKYRGQVMLVVNTAAI